MLEGKLSSKYRQLHTPLSHSKERLPETPCTSTCWRASSIDLVLWNPRDTQMKKQSKAPTVHLDPLGDCPIKRMSATTICELLSPQLDGTTTRCQRNSHLATRINYFSSIQYTGVIWCKYAQCIPMLYTFSILSLFASKLRSRLASPRVYKVYLRNKKNWEENLWFNSERNLPARRLIFEASSRRVTNPKMG